MDTTTMSLAGLQVKIWEMGEDMDNSCCFFLTSLSLLEEPDLVVVEVGDVGPVQVCVGMPT